MIVHRHGTLTGWKQHQQLDERPCDACYRAKQAYDARRRVAPVQLRRSRLMARAQGQARAVLQQRYSDEYRVLYDTFKAELLESEEQ